VFSISRAILSHSIAAHFTPRIASKTKMVSPRLRGPDRQRGVPAAADYRRASLHLITLQPVTALDLPRAVRVHSAVEWLLGVER
jgi:hypothetical protein